MWPKTFKTGNTGERMTNDEPEDWTVKMSVKARKSLKRSKATVQQTVTLLIQELKNRGPSLPGWPHFGKLTGRKDMYHCHLWRKHPVYVAVWKVDKAGRTITIIEIETHENVTY